MKPFLSLILLLAASVASGQSVKLPIEIKGEVGEFIQVKSETADKIVKWRVLDKGINLFPIELLRDTKTAIVIAAKPGRYRLIAWTAKDDVPSDIAETVVVVGSPIPEPGPIPPPDPPKPPVPPVPVPDDPINKAIFGAYQQEFAPDKKESAEKMAQCYSAAAKIALSATTWGDIAATIRTKAGELGIAGKLPVVAKTINAQLIAAGFPASPSVLMQPGDADKANVALVKVALALSLLP